MLGALATSGCVGRPLDGADDEGHLSALLADGDVASITGAGPSTGTFVPGGETALEIDTIVD